MGTRDKSAAALRYPDELMRHIAEVAEASKRGDAVTAERLAEIRANDADLCGRGLGFNGYSMDCVDRHDLLRHLDTLTTSAPTPAPAAPAAAPAHPHACRVCGCTENEPCDGGCRRFASSLGVALCTACARAIARDALAAGLYHPFPGGALFRAAPSGKGIRS